MKARKNTFALDWSGWPALQSSVWSERQPVHREVHEGKKKNRKRPRMEEADDQTADSQQH